MLASRRCMSALPIHCTLRRCSRPCSTMSTFSEKPMATTLHEAKQILDAIAAVGRSIKSAITAVLRRYINLPSSKSWRLWPYLGQRQDESRRVQQPPWVPNTAFTGGFLYESTVHLLDMMRWLMGEIVEVSAERGRTSTASSTISSCC